MTASTLLGRRLFSRTLLSSLTLLALSLASMAESFIQQYQGRRLYSWDGKYLSQYQGHRLYEWDGRYLSQYQGSRRFEWDGHYIVDAEKPVKYLSANGLHINSGINFALEWVFTPSKTGKTHEAKTLGFRRSDGPFSAGAQVHH